MRKGIFYENILVIILDNKINRGMAKKEKTGKNPWPIISKGV
jgi:hypothetical protein